MSSDFMTGVELAFLGEEDRKIALVSQRKGKHEICDDRLDCGFEVLGKFAGVGQGIEERIKNHREWRITVSLIPKHIGGV